MPFKYHAEHRHHIPKPRYRVTNWAEYDAALKRRGSLTVWFTDEAVAAWRAEVRTTPGGQPHYSALAITTALTLRAVFGLALRQTEGLISSIIGLIGLDLAVPGLCCIEAGHEGPGRNSPSPVCYLSNTNIIRASEFQHSVQCGGSEGDLGRLGLVCA